MGLTVLSLKHYQSRCVKGQNTKSEALWIVQAEQRALKGSWRLLNLQLTWGHGRNVPSLRQLDLECHCHNPIAGLKENKFDKVTFPLSCGSNPGAGDPFGVLFEQGSLEAKRNFRLCFPVVNAGSLYCSLHILMHFHYPPGAIRFTHCPKTVHEPLRLHQNWRIRVHIP